MRIFVLASVSRNGVIGKDGRKPWRVEGETEAIKRTLYRQNVIVGRKTYESMPTVGFEHTRVCVLTGQKNYKPSQYKGVESIDVFSSAQQVMVHFDNQDYYNTMNLWCIGGRSVFEQFMPFATDLWMHLIDRTIKPDGSESGKLDIFPFKGNMQGWKSMGVFDAGLGMTLVKFTRPKVPFGLTDNIMSVVKPDGQRFTIEL